MFNIKKNKLHFLEIIILFLIVSSCSNFNSKFVEYKRLLPDPSLLPCCWQLREKVEIISNSNRISLSSATVISENELVVVIFDSLGRKLLNISQIGRSVKVTKEQGITLELPIELLLLGIYLHDMPNSGWSFEGSNWFVERNGDKKILRQANRIVLSLTEVNASKEKLTEGKLKSRKIIDMYYHDLDLRVEITRLTKLRL